MKKLIIAVGLLLSFAINNLFGQRSMYFTNANYSFYQGLREYEANHLNESIQWFQLFLKQYSNEKSIFIDEASYLLLLIDVKLNRPNAENRLVSFLMLCPYQQFKILGFHELANYFYHQGRFEKAIPYYEKANRFLLSSKELKKKQSALAYSYLVANETEKYTELESSMLIADKDSFTLGMISIYKKEYTKAVQLLSPLKDKAIYKNTIPYYLDEINYLTGKKEVVLNNAKTNLSQKNRSVNEYNQLAGQLYFNDKDYANSEKYFTKYIALSSNTRRDDYYRIGYAQFQQANFEDAVFNFERMYKKNDELTQACYYYLAICYLALDKKNEAYSALLESINLDFNKEISEASEFNLSKLSYDKGDDAWSDKQLKFFQKKYPQSSFKDEALELESYIHIKTDRFDDAILAMDSMKNISLPLQKVYQRANYARGIQMLIAQHADKADRYFSNSTKYSIDQDLVILTTYWQAECQYRLGQYQNALSYTDIYLKMNKSSSYAAYDKNIRLLRSYLYMHLNQNDNLKSEYKYINPTQKGDPSISLGTLKPNFIPDKIPIIDNDPYIITYNLPLIQVEYQYTPVPQRLSFESNSINNSYIKLGLGNFGAFEVETGIDVSGITHSPFYINVKRNSLKGKLANQEYSQTHVGLYTTPKLKSFNLELNGEFDQNEQYYYGYDHGQYQFEQSSIRQSFKNLIFGAKLIPQIDLMNGIDVIPSIQVGFYSDAYGVNENNVYIHVPARKKINTETEIDLSVEADINVFSAVNQSTQSNSTLSLKPSFTKRCRGTTFKAGLYPTFAKQNHLLPDLSITYPLASMQSQLNFQYQNTLDLNTFKQLTQLNPFVFNQYTATQSKNSTLTLGLNGSINENCMYSLKIGIAQYRNLPLFLNDTSSDFKQFNILFADKAKAWITDFQFDYKIHKSLYAGVIAELRPLLSIANVDKAWHYVPATIDFYSKIKLTHTISTKADFFIRYGYAHLAKSNIVNSIYSTTSNLGFDLNLTTDFRFSTKWTGYVNILNVLNTKYQRWYNYPNLGTQFRVGLIRSFRTTKN